ncbi:MAG: hypothetical protein U5K76_08245 [Woeseiaceae bacterium]|nr:hypothetical protein [Woeseiaceae bacterium]
MALALFVGERSATARPALDLLAQQLGDARAGLVRNYHAALVAGGVHLRLPLLEIAVPALRQTPERQLEYLLELGRRLIEIDNRVDLHEFCLYRTLRHTLGQAVAPAGRSTPRASRQAVRDAAIELLAVVADAGHSSDNARRTRVSVPAPPIFGDWAANATFAPPERRVEKLERCLDVLQRMNNAARRSMVEALAAAAGDDDRLNVAEAELLRTVCATLDCPLPPLPPPASVS